MGVRFSLPAPRLVASLLAPSIHSGQVGAGTLTRLSLAKLGFAPSTHSGQVGAGTLPRCLYIVLFSINEKIVVMNPSKIYTFKELEQNEFFDPITICKDTPFTQANFYGDWQRYFNRTVKRYLVKSNDEIIAYFQIIKYPLIFGKSYLYIPYGPIMKDSSLSL